MSSAVDTKLDINELLEESYNLFKVYEQFRSCYPKVISQEFCPSDSKCVWCKQGKRKDFKINDLETTKSMFCHYFVNWMLTDPQRKKGSIYFEPFLNESSIKELKELNKFVITTEFSCYDPDDNLSISIITNKEMVDKLVKSLHIDEYKIEYRNDYDVEYGIYFNKELICININDLIKRSTLYQVILKIVSK